jgi:hypothetical protein
MDYVEKSFASASETSKLLLTLSTAVIAFCAAFVNVKKGDETLLTPANGWDKWFLGGSLIMLLGSTAVGLWTQLAITDVLSGGSDSNPVSVWSRKIGVPFQIHIFVFSLGILLLTGYVISRMVG